jgi:tetratricopeptide (TPR) repeat protein
MARGATKRNQQVRAARAAAPKRKPSRGARRQSTHTYEQAMFFPKLRTHAKWVFVFLAFAFAIGFVVFGVGTGSGFGGLGDLISGSNNTAGGPSASDLQKKVAQNPGDAAAWRQLATNYETSGNTDKAINALAHYTSLKPKSVSGLNELAAQYQKKATNLSARAQAVQSQASAFTPNPSLQPQPISPGTKKHPGQAFIGTPVIDSTVASVFNSRLQKLQTDSRTAFAATEGTYHKIAALQPRNSQVQLALASAAQQGSDYPTAIVALKRFLALEPNSTEAPLVRKQLKSLEAFSQVTPVQTQGG